MTVADTAITVAAMTGGVPVVPPVPALPPSPNATPPSPPAKIACSAYDISMVFDPLNQTDLTTLAEKLNSSVTGFNISIQSPGSDGPHVNGNTQVDGLVYRVATSVIITTFTRSDPPADCQLALPMTSQALLVVVPDSRADFILPAEAGPFTTTNVVFGFSNGMLTDYTDQKPSELAAIAGVPLTIVNHIVSIPAQILQLRVNYDTQEANLENARTTLLQSKIAQTTAFVAAQTSLQNAQNALVQAQGVAATDPTGNATALAKAQAALVQAQTALKNAQAAGSSP